jgi:nitrite reductase/ring-hydroxylating ferredoxin subunit
MTVARVGGEMVALQEFCTHRFGPLSEGCFRDGQVVCPWHGSAFDVRTGAVKRGPAKVDLRTFEAATRDGKIVVRVPRQAASEERRTA